MRARKAPISSDVRAWLTPAGRIVDKRQVRILGVLGERLFRVAAFRLKAASQQTLANPHLQRGGAQQITAAHDIINTHIEVIHDHDQLIAEQSIARRITESPTSRAKS